MLRQPEKGQSGSLQKNPSHVCNSLTFHIPKILTRKLISQNKTEQHRQ